VRPRPCRLGARGKTAKRSKRPSLPVRRRRRRAPLRRAAVFLRAHRFCRPYYFPQVPLLLPPAPQTRLEAAVAGATCPGGRRPCAPPGALAGASTSPPVRPRGAGRSPRGRRSPTQPGTAPHRRPAASTAPAGVTLRRLN
jgi:hypothetical protein